MNNFGKGLADVLNEVEETKRQKNKGTEEETAALNVEIPKALLKDIKLISAHQEVKIKTLVSDLLKDAVARRKSEMVQDLLSHND